MKLPRKAKKTLKTMERHYVLFLEDKRNNAHRHLKHSPSLKKLIQYLNLFYK